MVSEGIIAVTIGGICSIIVAWVSKVRSRELAEPERSRAAPAEESDPPPGLQVSPEIWEYFSGRFETLEEKVDHLTVLVGTKEAEVSALERMLRQAMRIIRRANRRLVAREETPEEIPRELIPYSIE